MGMIRGVIKVVDDLDTVDTSKTDPSLPPPSTGPSCCAVPLEDESSEPSIYDGLSQVPTEELIHKAQADGKNQSVTFKGIGSELKPLVAITSTKSKTMLTFDFNDFDNAEDQYYILDVDTGEQVFSFTGKKGINEIEFSPPEAGGYAIIGDDYVLAIIEVVDDMTAVDLAYLREFYLP